MKISLQTSTLCALSLGALFASVLAHGQSYPAKPVRLIISGPPGGGADVIMRPIAQRLSEQMGQQVVADNRPGAGSIIAAQILMASPPTVIPFCKGAGVDFPWRRSFSGSCRTIRSGTLFQ